MSEAHLVPHIESMRATLRVLIEGQAQMYADLCRLQSDAPIGEDDYRALMDEWKQDTAKLIKQILDREWDEEQERIESGHYTDDPQ